MNGPRTAHLCIGGGGSLWTGAILGWNPVYGLDFDKWRIQRLIDQREAGWWPPGIRLECADLNTWQPPDLDGELDLFAAGFSCKDISTAGKGEGLGGKSTGPTYSGCLRAIDAWRPKRIFFENSPAIRAKGRSQVTHDLVARGYRWRDGVIAASDVGAGHERSRWFLLAEIADINQSGRRENANELSQRRSFTSTGVEVAPDSDGLRELEPRRGQRDERGRNSDGLETDSNPDISGWAWWPWNEPEAQGWNESPDLSSNLDGEGFPLDWFSGMVQDGSGEAIQAAQRYTSARTWNPPHPDLCRVVDGLAHGKHRGDKGRRIEALGDAWVPLQAAAAYMILSKHQADKARG